MPLSYVNIQSHLNTPVHNFTIHPRYCMHELLFMALIYSVENVWALHFYYKQDTPTSSLFNMQFV